MHMLSSREISAPAFASFFALVFGSALQVRAAAFYNPAMHGGSTLDNAGVGLGTYDCPPGVLTDVGIVNYAHAIGFWTECLGIHIGNPQSANLDHGNGWVNQTIEIRQDYGDPGAGTWRESLVGGNHFRVFRQNGSLADSGALFLAVSQEEPASENHNIVSNGYNIGRDRLVSIAVGKTTFSYSTTAKNITGLLTPGLAGVNHGISQDGIVTLLTATII